MDDMASPNKFGEVTWPSSDFMGRSVIYRPDFLGILQIVRFSGFTSDVIMDEPAKFLFLISKLFIQDQVAHIEKSQNRLFNY